MPLVPKAYKNLYPNCYIRLLNMYGRQITREILTYTDIEKEVTGIESTDYNNRQTWTLQFLESHG